MSASGTSLNQTINIHPEIHKFWISQGYRITSVRGGKDFATIWWDIVGDPMASGPYGRCIAKYKGGHMSYRFPNSDETFTENEMRRMIRLKAFL